VSKLLTIKWMQLLVHIWRNRETNGKQQLDNLSRIGSMVTHFQLPPYEFHWATRQARDIAISANSPGIRFFSKEKLRGRTQRLLEIIPYRKEERGWLPIYILLHPCPGQHGQKYPRIFPVCLPSVVQLFLHSSQFCVQYTPPNPYIRSVTLWKGLKPRGYEAARLLPGLAGSRLIFKWRWTGTAH
jgi:hypothetical protein